MDSLPDTMSSRTVSIRCGDVLTELRKIPANSIHLVVTSPPYLALRVYSGVGSTIWADGSSSVLGLEPNIHAYIAHMVEICGELQRVLHPSGNFYMNIGDSYQHGGPQPSTGIHRRNEIPLPNSYKRDKVFKSKKQLGMVPARLAIALQDRDWILREQLVWAKGVSFCRTYSGSVMPESIRDRCVAAWEPVFHFVKKDAYFYDIDGCREPYADSTLRDVARGYTGQGRKPYADNHVQNPSEVKRRTLDAVATGAGRNLRNVWVIPKEPLREAHFAAFPTKLVEPVIKLGTSEHGACPICLSPWERVTHREEVPEHIRKAFEDARTATVADTGRTDGHTQRKPNYRRKVLGVGWRPTCVCEPHNPIPCTVLDPFCGSGRAGIVAVREGRNFIGIDASAEYCAIANRVIGEVHV